MFLSISPDTPPGGLVQEKRRALNSDGEVGPASCLSGETRDAPREEGCTVQGGGEGRESTEAHDKCTQSDNLFICIFPSDFSSRRRVSAEHSPHPLFLFPGPRSSLPGLAPKASMDVFSTHRVFLSCLPKTCVCGAKMRQWSPFPLEGASSRQTKRVKCKHN